MSLKLITVNIEGNEHLDLVIPFLKKEKADIICMQEVLGENVEQLEKETGLKAYFFRTHTNTDQFNLLQGVAILTNLKHSIVAKHYYLGTESIVVSNDPNQFSRVVGVMKVIKDKKEFTIATTHFTWSPKGRANDLQRKSLQDLLKDLKPYPEHILCGDFNAPKGKEIFISLAKKYKDNIPKSVDSTLDPLLHRVKGLKYVVDYVFSTKAYKVTDVKVVEGISDHKAIIAKIDLV